jgi:hypothetical protein
MNKRLGLFAVSIVVLVLSAIFSFTPAAWILSGRQSESYPEFLFAFFYLPTACLLLVDSGFILWFGRRIAPRTLGMRGLWLAALLKIAGIIALSLLAISPWFGQYAIGQELLNLYLPVILPMQIVASAVGIIWSFKALRPQPAA